MTTRLPLLTNSSITTFRRCPREYQYKYVMRRRSLAKAPALLFGTLFHKGLNAWWLWPSDATGAPARLLWALMAMNEHVAATSIDPFDHAKAIALMVGYTARWEAESPRALAVERNFRMPLGPVNHEHLASDLGLGFDLGGSVDAETGANFVEHKTTSSDITQGSDYWRHVMVLDPQVSTYKAATGGKTCIYDVIKKPTLMPQKATSEESRKYTKPTKLEPIPRLYKGQRETDETPEEYGQRLRDDIAENPAAYFARATIVRLDRDDEEHHRDVVGTAEMIRFCEERDAWPRSPNACQRFGRWCEFHAVCCGEASIDDARYETKERMHEELGDV